MKPIAKGMRATSDTAGKPLTCIIGAGPSGLATAKALADRGVPFDCFEKSGRIGGVWASANGSSAAYRSLCLNTSRDRSGFRDFAMPPDFPDFPHRSQMASYLEAYVDQAADRSPTACRRSLQPTLKAGADIGVLGIQLETRRRNHLTGMISAPQWLRDRRPPVLRQRLKSNSCRRWIAPKPRLRAGRRLFIVPMILNYTA